MNYYEEGMKILKQKIGNNQDNVIALATIDDELSSTGKPRPAVRDLNAIFEDDGVLYALTNASSKKMKEIAANSEVSISANFEDFRGNGEAKSLGWILDPKNATIREKFQKAFVDWYEWGINENDQDYIVLAIYLRDGILRINFGAIQYHFDFINKTATKTEREFKA